MRTVEIPSANSGQRKHTSMKNPTWSPRADWQWRCPSSTHVVFLLSEIHKIYKRTSNQNKYWTTIGYKYRWAKNLLSLIGIRLGNIVAIVVDFVGLGGLVVAFVRCRGFDVAFVRCRGFGVAFVPGRWWEGSDGAFAVALVWWSICCSICVLGGFAEVSSCKIQILQQMLQILVAVSANIPPMARKTA